MRSKPLSEVAADFDAIAAALARGAAGEALTPAERWLVARVPGNARSAIDVGCGDGVISRALARRGLTVVAVDISRGMIDLARAKSDAALPIEYRQADVMRDELPGGAFDVVLSVAMAHHVSLDVLVPRLVRLVAPGGVLLLQDVMNRRGIAQIPVNLAAMVTRHARQLVVPSRVTGRVARAYDAHGANEEYLDASMVAQTYRSLMPDARVTLHLEWRYSVVWRAARF